MFRKKFLLLSTIGCLLFSFSFLPVAYSDNSAPIALHANVVTAQIVQSNDNILEVELIIPKVQGLTDAAYQNRLNKELLQKALKSKKYMEKISRQNFKESQKEKFEFHLHFLKQEYELINNEKILSFTVTTYEYTGRAHGMTYIEYYNIDLKENKRLQLKDLFTPLVDYKKIIDEEIFHQIVLRTEKEDHIYFTDEAGFKGINEATSFYVQGDNLIIAFALYEIAPYFMGIPNFVIPMSKFR